jgi:hypothetical protein
LITFFKIDKTCLLLPICLQAGKLKFGFDCNFLLTNQNFEGKSEKVKSESAFIQAF